MTPVFFVDRSLGKHDVPNALRAAGALVEVHDAHFAQDAPDEVWLPAVGQKGWAVLTSDDRIRYRQAEKSAATTAGVALFIFTGKRMRGAAIGDALVRALPEMTRLLQQERRPFIAKVTRTGTVSLVP
ncbi:MAG TPA: hypothetical protein VFL83_08185 [Anaeromyxobacter sp.]|nr:hypothetical protein [Anaeromyxobacter sp.]